MLRLLLPLPLASCAMNPAETVPPEPRLQVWQAEQAFARTMADRDLAAFRGFLAEDAVFLSGDQTARGPDQIAAAWAPLFEGPTAPLSWQPDRVEVTGDLALSTGPFFDGEGNRMGRFTSIWRRTADGWRVVFDKPDGE